MFMKAVFSLVALLAIATAEASSWKLSYELEEADTLTFGILPYKDPKQVRSELEPLAGYLSKQLARPVSVLVASSYQNLARLVDSGRISVAWFSRTSYDLLLAKQHRPWAILCHALPLNERGYRGLVITRADSGIADLGQLRGKSFAYVDRHSGTGFMAPNQILRDRGITPLSFFGTIVFTGSHGASAKGVLEGRFDAAAVYEDLVALLPPAERERLRILGTSGWIGADPLVVLDQGNNPQHERLRAVLLGMATDPEANQVLSHLIKVRGIKCFSRSDVAGGT